MTDYDWLNRYEEGVPATIDISTRPLTQVLTDSAQTYANKVALRMVLKYLPLGLSIQSRMTFGELDQASNRFAAGLQKIGLKKGDRVSIMLPNLPQGVVAFFGILKAGGTVVNTNPTYTPRELKHQLQDSGAETIIIMSGLHERLEQIRSETAVKNVIITDIPDTLGFPFKLLVSRQVRAGGLMKDIPAASNTHRFADLMNTPTPFTPVETVPDDVVLFQYTGGTTGLAKAAMLTNSNLVSNVAQMDAWFARSEAGKEVLLAAIPFFHVYGMTVAMLYSLHLGAELIIVPDPRNTTHVLDIIEREKVTLYPGVPTMYVAIVNHPKVQEYNLRSVKACLSGGAALPVEVAQQFERLTGGRLVEGFGMTECSPVACANPIYGETRIGSIGLPISNTNAEIVSLEPDKDGNYPRLAQGEEGELIIHGPQVMKGYWNAPEETANTIDEEGWLHTGDIAKMDEDGYFYIVDRKKELIIASGYNIVPREVEEVLFMHAKVQEAAVAGIPDPRRGETVKAYVVLKEGQECTVDEIISFCKENLAPYKVPKLLEFRTDLPKSQVGKVLRRVLVEEEKRKMAEKA